VTGLNHRPCSIERHRADSGFVLTKKCRVDLNELGVLRGNVDVFENRVDRANDLALLAVDADLGIDIKLRRSRFRVDACNGADFDAGAVVGAKIGYDVRHGPRFARNSRLQIPDSRSSNVADRKPIWNLELGIWNPRRVVRRVIRPQPAASP